MKRTVIVVLFVGLIAYLFFYFLNNRIKSKLTSIHLKYLTLFLVLTLINLPLFNTYIQRSFETREKKFEKISEDITQEGRIQEFIYISEEIVQLDNVSTLLFGKETFNLVGTYADGQFGSRQIHSDYSKLLHGTGIVGVFFWFCIHCHLIVWMVRLKKSAHTKTDLIASILFPLYFSFLIIYGMSMMSGVMDNLLSSSFFYTSLGGMLRYFYNKNISCKQYRNKVLNQ